MVWVALSVGRSAARALLHPICVYYLVFSRQARRAIRPYLARALGRPIGWRDLFRQYHGFASTLLDRVYLLAGQSSRFDIEIRGVELLKDRLARGQGCILLGSHLGSFEIVRAIGLSQRNIEIKVLMYEQNTPMIRNIFRDLNPAFSDAVIQTGSPDAMLRVKECLDRGGVVGILGDRLLKQDHATPCKFFGKLAGFPAGPMWLASILKAPVILFFGLYRGGNRYEVHFELFAEQVTIDRQHRDQEIQQWTQRYADRLERYCRLAADNWFNFYDFWGEQR
ncbi:MAG: lipid A biosynthesis acyltransferase [Nitrospirales bacterium]|nr:lipid A biosynthesis acyltransferase [Nitrospirales bacterium]